MAAYPVRQYQHPPPNSSLRSQEDQYGYPPQPTFYDDSYQHGMRELAVSDHVHRESPPVRNGGHSGAGSNYPAVGNPQWSENNAPRASPASRPYMTSAADSQIEHFRSRDHNGAHYNEATRPYDARRSPRGNPIHQYQEPGWRDPLRQVGSEQRRHYPPGTDCENAGYSRRGYNNVSAASGANMDQIPQNPYIRDRINGIRNPNVGEVRVPHNVQNQQKPKAPEQYGEGTQFPKPRNQLRTADPNIEKLKNPPKERILTSPMSPETVSWDNPFPTFPSVKAKNKHPHERDLNHSMAEMRVDHSLDSGNAGSLRPATAGGRIDHVFSSDSGQTKTRGERPVHTNQRVAHNQPPILQTQNGTLHYGPGSPGVNQFPLQPSINPRDQLQPRTVYNGFPKDVTRDESYGMPAAYQAGDQRSRTMPTTFTSAFVNSDSQWSYEKDTAVRGDRHELGGQNEHTYIERSPAPQAVRPPMQLHSRSADYPPESGHVNQEPQTLHPGSHHSQQASLGDFFDSYYHSPHHSDSSGAQGFTSQFAAPHEEEMPNFDTHPAAAAAHKRGMTIDDHLSSQQSTPALPSMPTSSMQGHSSSIHPGSQSANPVTRSKSSPNLQQQNSQESQQYSDGFDFELPGSIPAMYSLSPRPSHDNGNGNTHDEAPYQPPRNDWQHKPVPNPPQIPTHHQVPSNRPSPSESHGRPPHSRSPDMRNQPPMPKPLPPHGQQSREFSKRPSPVNRIGPRSPPAGPKGNPDALPAHPAPVRAGLMQSPPSNQPPRPPPVRQYTNGSSSLQESSSSQRAQISRAPREETKSAAVTYGELERLKQISRSNPSDNKTQLLLAKKLVEAASVLADDGGRADPKTSSRNRERFISDAHKLVKKLAQNGYSEAIFYLGDCYSRGSLGLQTDAKEAFGYYQSAAKAGHPQAAYRVAVCCEMGLDEGGGTRRDATKAMQWYQRAATLGDTPAMYKLGVIQLKALLGQPRDIKAALTWLQRAADRADKENPHALHELALLYESPNGIEGAGTDEAKARQLFTDAANLGYKFSQFRLGCTYEYGLLGCNIDPRQSIAWYSKAAVQDEHQSELALSGWYLTGSEGVLQQSDTEAYLWARKAAQAGLAKAEYAMGYFTEVGIGAPANIEDAKRWYWRSASQNFPKARERLEDLRRGGAKMQKTRVSRSKMNKQSEGECIVM